MARANWAGNYRYHARRLHRPSTVERAREIVAGAERIRVLGSRHSFTSIADSEELLSLDRLPATVDLDAREGSVSVAAGVRYRELAATLSEQGMALANLPSLVDLSVAGAVATASHGSGDRNGNLATAVSALEMISSNGDTITASRGDPMFDGMVVGLGALGAVTRLTCDVEPAFEVHQQVYERLAWDELFDHFDQIMGTGYSVSVFTLWTDVIEQVWVKQRTPVGSPLNGLYGAMAASVERHPIPGLDPANCTSQLGVPGRSSDRLPHFRAGMTPSSGQEIQSEYLVPRPSAIAAIRAVRDLAEQVRPLLQISEIRTIAADTLWMSPQHGCDTVGIHFTWRRRQRDVEGVLREVEAALRPLGARPHWGKLFLARANEIATLYDRMSDFKELAQRLDPRGAFRNSWLETHVVGSGGRVSERPGT